MATPHMSIPTFYRHRDSGMIGGVCSGIATYFGVNVAWVRLGFAGASLLVNVGTLFYILMWIATESRRGLPPPPDRFRAPVSWGLVGITVLGALVDIHSARSIGFLVFIAGGAVITWFALDRGKSIITLVLMVVGTSMILAGVVIGAVRWRVEPTFPTAIGTVLLTLAGVAALMVPIGVRIWQRMSAEREEKILSAERAEIAARLHDSVLQTLALIQKHAESPAEVIRLARGQERQLRRWLFEPETDTTLFTAIERACGEVEDIHAVRIAPVTVGHDQLLEPHVQALVLAAREAMVNAAKYAPDSEIDVYCENFDDIHIYIRDRGPGFDPQHIPADRHGIRDSICGRVERAGGKVNIRSQQEGDTGTEVEIIYPI
ncbi:PspC domain-containing protein [Corynebacterium sp. ES2730-CONJ]|uniref:ATP-binding protein n=1 Tax=Corynebacterium sp. ES2730-CONJ TaxID=2973941 RepID=UPI00216AC9AD|nr:PspC domain-containing protein [Corynebacterium sp. ES2730-CONJ]MCS4531467.1 PspC domain-containing protein [Corynebacterium sp. ES2730-CONJ]